MLFPKKTVKLTGSAVPYTSAGTAAAKPARTAAAAAAATSTAAADRHERRPRRAPAPPVRVPCGPAAGRTPATTTAVARAAWPGGRGVRRAELRLARAGGRPREADGGAAYAIPDKGGE